MFQSGGSSQEKHRSSSLQPVNPGKLFSTFSFTCPWDLCISRLFFWKIVCTLFVESKTLYKKPFEELKKPRRSFLDSNHKSVKYVFSPIFTSIDVVGKCPPPPTCKNLFLSVFSPSCPHRPVYCLCKHQPPAPIIKVGEVLASPLKSSTNLGLTLTPF